MRFLSFIGLSVILGIGYNAVAQNADINILRQINGHYTQSGGTAFKIVSNSVTPIAIGTPLVLFAAAGIKKDHELIWDGVEVGSASITTGLITSLLKITIQRKRPFDEYSDINKQGLGGSYSFPSGHTSAAFSTATSLSFLYPKWYVIIPAYAYAISAGWSRMYLGVHYPSDVLIGALLGTGLSIGMHYFVKGLKKKKDSKLNMQTYY